MCSSLAILGATVGTKVGEWTRYMQRVGQGGSDLAKVSGSCFVSQISEHVVQVVDTNALRTKLRPQKSLVAL